MKFKILALIVLILPGKVSYCQTNARIADIDFRLDNNNIIVNYSIIGASVNEVFTIDLKFITETDQAIIPRSLTGDAGPNIRAGLNKTIIWDIQKDNLEISGVMKAVVTILSSVTITGDMFSKETPKKANEKGMGGPGYMALSAFWPGLGGYFVEKKKTRAILTNLTAVGLMAFSVSQSNLLSQYDAEYDVASTVAEKNRINDKIAIAEQNFSIGVGGFCVLWFADLIWVAAKGFKNQKAKNSRTGIYNNNSFTLNYIDDGLQFSYRMNF